MSRLFAWTLMLLMPALCVAGESSAGCHRFGFSGRLEAGQTFQKSIGDDLDFSIAPSVRAGTGWSFEIGAPGDKHPLYIYDVTPPWRGRHQTRLDTSYAIPAGDAVAKGDTDFWFVLDRQGDRVASHAVGQLIFSGANQSDETSLAELDAVPKGHGVFRIVDSAFVPGTITTEGVPIPPQYLRDGYPDKATLKALYGEILKLTFEVELTVPADFRVPSTFHAEEAACPGSWMETVLPHSRN